MEYNDSTIKQPFIPYFATSRYRVKAMVELADIKGDERMADLGSGDGRIAIEFAKKGVIVDGFELEDEWIRKSEENISRENLTHMISIQKADFWDVDLSPYEIVCIYPMPDILEELENKLQRELHSGARVLVNYYQFPNWKYKKMKDKVYLYEVK